MRGASGHRMSGQVMAVARLGWAPLDTAGRVRAGLASSRLGSAPHGSASPGVARRGSSSLVKACQFASRRGGSGHGMARRGLAPRVGTCLGLAWRGTAWCGGSGLPYCMARLVTVWHVGARLGLARHGSAPLLRGLAGRGQAWRGETGRGSAGPGSAWLSIPGLGEASRVMSRQVGTRRERVESGLVPARPGAARRVSAWLGSPLRGLVWQCRSWQVRSVHGSPRHRSASHVAASQGQAALPYTWRVIASRVTARCGGSGQDAAPLIRGMSGHRTVRQGTSRLVRAWLGFPSFRQGTSRLGETRLGKSVLVAARRGMARLLFIRPTERTRHA